MFEYPPQSRFGRPLPKSTIFAHARPSSRIRSLFASQIAEIIWTHKLAPETINLPARAAVTEIQVFALTLKQGECDEAILRAMDKAIPSLLLFELFHAGRIRFAATYKRANRADPAKLVIGRYFVTAWQPEPQARLPLPQVLDLAALYERILHEHCRHSPPAPLPRAGENLDALMERVDAIHAKERECRRLEARIQKEVQFNRKVEWNALLRTARAELAALRQE